jgi:hypothetical protein
MSAINQRLQALLDEREMLEAGRKAIAAGLPIPTVAQQYVTAKTNDEAMHGDELRNWFDMRLKEIDRQIRLFPVASFRRSSSIVNVVGKDYSQFEPAP